VLNFLNDIWARDLRVQRFIEAARKLARMKRLRHEHPTYQQQHQRGRAWIRDCAVAGNIAA
jgi:hypothetical protein